MAGEEESLVEAQRIEQLKKTVLKKILSKQAWERLARIKLVKPDLANQLEAYLVQLYQAGKIRTEISDEQIKMILDTVSSKKDFKIIK